MSRSPSTPPTDHAITIETPQSPSNSNNNVSTTIEGDIATASLGPEPPPEGLFAGKLPNTETMVEKTPATSVIIPNSPAERDLSSLSQYEERFDDGYDSDGMIGPFWECRDLEGEQDFEEDIIDALREDGHESMEVTMLDGFQVSAFDINEPPPESNDAITTQEESKIEADTPPNRHVPISDDVLKGLKVKDLKDELRRRQQPVSGNKSVLLRRLEHALENKLPVVCVTNESMAASASDSKKPKGMGAFADGAYWRVLHPNEESLKEPENPTFIQPRAPTIEERDAAHVPTKYNFTERLDRPPFLGTVERPVVEKGARRSLVRTTFRKQPRTRGCVNPSFIKKHGLTKDSTPSQYMDLILPFKKNIIDGKERLSFEQLMRWTNTKAHLAGAGKGGSYYTDYKDFTVTELRQHIGLYVLHGISPSPRIEYKFKSQGEDKVHGNDFVFRSFGTNAERRHKHFKAFFACQNPMINPPERKHYPNWKVRPIITWMNYIFPTIWMLGVAFSIDEMTMGFKGKHADKRRITYKVEGDGFQGDALCQDGFMYQVFMRNDPAPLKYQRMGLSPLHARVMALFDSLKDDHHQCAMDNLYNSAAFCKAAVNHERKVLCHGVTRKGSRGIPTSVMQEEVKDRKKQLEVRGTVKAAVLEGDNQCTGLVACSVYDTKPVYYLSMVCEELKWLEVEKQVYNVDTGKMESLRFLRLNTIDNYNKTMGNVDIADQLRGSYRVDHWIRNRKWWWSLWFWSLGVMLTNAYIMKCNVDLQCGVSKENLMSQHDFRKHVALYWINPEEYKRENGVVIEVNTRKRKGTTDSTVSSVTKSSSRSLDSSATTRSNASRPPVHTKSRAYTKSRASVVTDETLKQNGNLRNRLNSALDHLPEPTTISSNPRCALHRWVGIEKKAQIMKCTTCNVNLCLDCYKKFHSVVDLVSIKQSLKNKYSK